MKKNEGKKSKLKTACHSNDSVPREDRKGDRENRGRVREEDAERLEKKISMLLIFLRIRKSPD